MEGEDYNQEHYDKLKEGVKSWNEWREENPTIKPLLRGADLLAANLGGADLRRADLQGAKFWRANLEEANLWEANNLTGGQICKAETLYRAKLGVELEKQIKEKCRHKLTQGQPSQTGTEEST